MRNQREERSDEGRAASAGEWFNGRRALEMPSGRLMSRERSSRNPRFRLVRQPRAGQSLVLAGRRSASASAATPATTPRAAGPTPGPAATAGSARTTRAELLAAWALPHHPLELLKLLFGEDAGQPLANVAFKLVELGRLSLVELQVPASERRKHVANWRSTLRAVEATSPRRATSRRAAEPARRTWKISTPLARRAIARPAATTPATAVAAPLRTAAGGRWRRGQFIGRDGRVAIPIHFPQRLGRGVDLFARQRAVVVGVEQLHHGVSRAIVPSATRRPVAVSRGWSGGLCDSGRRRGQQPEGQQAASAKRWIEHVWSSF